MVQLKKICFAPILFLWLLSACTPSPEAAATIAVVRPTDTATPTITAITNQSLPSPTPLALVTSADTPMPTAAPTTTPLPTPISTEDVQATNTALQATSIAQDATFFAPTSTFTPSPTFTPIPGPVWTIFFRGIPCPEGFRCEDTLFMDQSSAGYLINSDGSQLTPIDDLGLSSDMSHPLFSPDKTQLAYLDIVKTDGLGHLFLANADGSEAIDLGTGNIRDFQFLPETGCLIIAQSTSLTAEGQNFVIEKRCVGQPSPQELDTVLIPGLQSQLSPQGDALLVYGKILTGEANLWIHEIQGETKMLFSQASEYYVNAFRWLPDAPKIELVTFHYVPTTTITSMFNTITTFNLIEQDGIGQEVQLNMATDFEITGGTWLPDSQQFVFTYTKNDIAPSESGLYVLDLNTGESRQILSHFYLGGFPTISVWKQITDK